MEKVVKTIVCAVSLMALAACSGTKSSSVVELSQYDKHLDCTELQLEITEAKFLQDKAEKNRGLSVKNVLMPLSYPSTYFSAGDAIETTTARIDYLSRLYEVKGCTNQRQADASNLPEYDGTGRGGYQGVSVGASAPATF